MVPHPDVTHVGNVVSATVHTWPESLPLTCQFVDGPLDGARPLVTRAYPLAFVTSVLLPAAVGSEVCRAAAIVAPAEYAVALKMWAMILPFRY